MQASNGSIIGTIIICAILLGGLMFLMAPSVPTVEEISSKVLEDITIPEVPTAEDIGSKINITIPEAKPVDNSKVNDIWKIMFNDCYTDLEDEAEEQVIDEVEDNIDDLEEFIEDSVEDFDKLKNLELDEDKTDVSITDIGYCDVDGTEFGDDEDDKEAIVTLVYEFKYQDTSDNTWYKETVEVTGTIEFDEGDFDDEKIKLVYSL